MREGGEREGEGGEREGEREERQSERGSRERERERRHLEFHLALGVSRGLVLELLPEPIRLSYDFTGYELLKQVPSPYTRLRSLGNRL